MAFQDTTPAIPDFKDVITLKAKTTDVYVGFREAHKKAKEMYKHSDVYIRGCENKNMRIEVHYGPNETQEKLTTIDGLPIIFWSNNDVIDAKSQEPDAYVISYYSTIRSQRIWLLKAEREDRYDFVTDEASASYFTLDLDQVCVLANMVCGLYCNIDIAKKAGKHAILSAESCKNIAFEVFQTKFKKTTHLINKL